MGDADKVHFAACKETDPASPWVRTLTTGKGLGLVLGRTQAVERHGGAWVS